ncbi:V4R domain-containing protein [Microbaculum marinum]|uniref:V4R domain-containing protein n=1 Tax=Microbaculum marinum TaxID=1764581 RepID=A0AAW9RY07_9HYPH
MAGFRDRLRFDAETGAYLDRDIRYMLIRPDALMGLFARLSDSARTEAFAAIADSITERGRHSAQSYVAPDEADRLLRVISDSAPQLGWGIWNFEHQDDDVILLEVRNSPFAHAAGELPPPVCYPIVGMLRAVGSMVLGDDVAVEETQCAAGGGEELCRFAIRRSAMQPGQP